MDETTVIWAVASVITRTDLSKHGPFSLLVLNGELICCNRQYLKKGYLHITDITRQEIAVGLSSARWKWLVGKLRQLVKEGVIK